MESKLLINSIVLGGALFVGIIVFWYIFGYLKKRVAADKLNQAYSADSKMSWEEKRRHPRVELSWPAFLEKAERRQEAQLKDLSLGGAFLICQEPLALQDQFKVTFILPNQEHLELNAEVVWSNVNMPSDRVVNRGMGIRFIKNEKMQRQILQDAIAVALEKTGDSSESNGKQ
jgi:Tfp pilus assembly protein PilZ